MIWTFALLVGSAGLIYFSCESFVNSIEWLGQKLRLTQTATGTVLAAVGTALPESAVTLVAVAFSHSTAQKEIGIGAAIGGPLVLSTVAYAVVGLVLLANPQRLGRKRSRTIKADTQRLQRDQRWFLAIFVIKVALGLVALSFKPWLGLAFLIVYTVYCWRELSYDDNSDGHQDSLEPLRLRPRDSDPALRWIIIQTLAALAIIFTASHLFVKQIALIGPWLGLGPQLTALLLSPLATELPEIMNALIWVRQGKERLALANISGAMMIQATIPTAFGLFFTSWCLATSSIIAAGVTITAIAFLQWSFRLPAVNSQRLIHVGWLYIVFAGLLFIIKSAH